MIIKVYIRKIIYKHSRRDSNPRSLEWESNILGQLDDESIIMFTPGWTRTINLQLRRRLLYPLSYWSEGFVVVIWFAANCIVSFFIQTKKSSIEFFLAEDTRRCCNDQISESSHAAMWCTQAVFTRCVAYSTE